MTVRPDAAFFPSGDLKTRLHFHRTATDALSKLLTTPWTLVSSAGGKRRLDSLGTLRTVPAPSEVVIVPSGLLTLADLRQAWQPGPPCVVAIGAGSVLDAGKLVRLANSLGHFPDDRRDWTIGDETTKASLICIPTTAGSGAELTATSSLWEGGKKSSIDGPSLRPSDAIYDSSLLLSAGQEIRTAALWDATTHALEAMWSRHATQASDDYASFALRTIADTLRREAGPTDNALGVLSLASAAAGAAITVTRTGIAHALSYPLTARHGVRHGLAAGIFGVATAGLLTEFAPERAARIGRALRAPIAILEEFWRTTGANAMVADLLTGDALQAQAETRLDPQRANLSVIPPERGIVRAICDRAATIGIRS